MDDKIDQVQTGTTLWTENASRKGQKSLTATASLCLYIEHIFFFFFLALTIDLVVFPLPIEYFLRKWSLFILAVVVLYLQQLPSVY